MVIMFKLLALYYYWGGVCVLHPDCKHGKQTQVRLKVVQVLNGYKFDFGLSHISVKY